MAKDFYDILGISKSSDAKEIKSAYKKIAVKYHPDKNPGNAEAELKFKEAAEAYGTLSDSEKRSRYDQYGHDNYQQMGNSGGGSNQGFSNFDDIFSNFGDVFGDVFGGGSRSGGRRSSGRRSAPSGEDIQIELNLTLKEISKGVTKKVRLKRYTSCSICSGQGGKNKQSCKTCEGAGQVRQTQNTMLGQFSNIVSCPNCRGQGFSFAQNCQSCHGEGRERSKGTTIAIDIPAGVSEGNYLTLRGQGHSGANGGANGDLIALIHEKKHEIFNREKEDLYLPLEISFSSATLGEEIVVPTIDGKAKLKIPAGTASEKLFRIKGQGLPVLNGHGKGDQFVRVRITVPTQLSDKERSLIQELRDLESKKPQKKSFFEKIF